MMRVGGMSEGRDIGVVFNLPRKSGACVLPVCGGVGTQYTPAVGWAQALRYRAEVLGDPEYANSIAVAHGGDASTATNGFWAALNIVTTERLPFLFFIEDNGYGISVPSRQQTPGGNIARNLEGFRGLRVLDGDASDPMAAAALIENAVTGVRSGGGPALIRLAVPRLSGHSGQDTQTYKSAAEIAAERQRDPLSEAARAAGTGSTFGRRLGSRDGAKPPSGGGRSRRRRAAQHARSRARSALCVFGSRRGRFHRAAAAGRNLWRVRHAAAGHFAGKQRRDRASIW